VAPAETEAAMADAEAAVIETPSQSRVEADAATEVASLSQPAAAGSDSGAASSTLEISSNQRVEQKSIWLREAYAAYQAGNDELAMSLYNKVLEIDPLNRNALLARAAIHVQNTNSREAIRDYQALLLANPKDSLAMASLLAVANYSPQDTETQLKLMIRDEPNSPYLNFALANSYGAQNRWQEAQGHYFRALENNPGDPNYAYNLAVSLEHISQPRAAISYYRRALDNFGNGLATFSREVVDQRLEMLGKL
jgi:tetratricopeptide (TPR) repeat protein